MKYMYHIHMYKQVLRLKIGIPCFYWSTSMEVYLPMAIITDRRTTDQRKKKDRRDHREVTLPRGHARKNCSDCSVHIISTYLMMSEYFGRIKIDYFQIYLFPTSKMSTSSLPSSTSILNLLTSSSKLGITMG